MLSAIEIYNKPNFSYREETFAILATNSLELLFKAQLLKKCAYQLRSLYILEPAMKKDGKPHKSRTIPKLNRSKNPTTIGLYEVIKRLEQKGMKLTQNHLSSIETLVELRDNSIHFHNEKDISKEMQEIGLATIKNYINLIKRWDIEIDLSSYNFYLMPLAYVDAKVLSQGVITEEVSNYLDFVKSKIQDQEVKDQDFDIAISIEVSFSKTNSFDGLDFKYGENGLEVNLSEENIRKRFPLTYDQVIKEARERYSDFKQNKEFNAIMKRIKQNKKLYHERRLDLDNPKSPKKPYYSSNIWNVLNNHYSE